MGNRLKLGEVVHSQTPSTLVLSKYSYILNMCIKWKEALKRETVIVSVMGMDENETEIPFTLVLLGHNDEVLATQTKKKKFVKSGVGMEQEFNVKSLLGNLKEEEIGAISAEIKILGQKIWIPKINRLVFPIICLERYNEASKQDGVEKCRKGINNYRKAIDGQAKEVGKIVGMCCGYWSEPTMPFSDNQTNEGINKQYQTSTTAKPFNLDPKKFNMQKEIDIGQQSFTSVNSKNGYMKKVYQKALKHKGEPQEFAWMDESTNKRRKHAFNSNFVFQILSDSTLLGAVSATIHDGKITVCGDGSYYIEGRLVYNRDLYSWIEDAKDTNSFKKYLHNKSIEIGGMIYGNKASDAYINNPIDKEKGQMPIEYARDYHFYIYVKNNQ